MGSTDLPAQFTFLLAAYGAVILLTVFLPFIASFILDGIVLIIRKRGPRGLFLAVAFSIVVAVAGGLALQYGLNGMENSAASAPSMALVAQMLLTFSIPLATAAFLVRTASQFFKARRRAA